MLWKCIYNLCLLKQSALKGLIWKIWGLCYLSIILVIKVSTSISSRFRAPCTHILKQITKHLKCALDIRASIAFTGDVLYKLILIGVCIFPDKLINTVAANVLAHYVAGHQQPHMILAISLIARFMEPSWGPSGADRTQMGPMLAPWTLLSRLVQ